MSQPIKTFGIIGAPVSHSLSPAMQNAAFAARKLSCLYKTFPVKKSGLQKFLKDLNKKDITGLNVTIPHKQAVIPYLDTLSPEAKLIGAVNTIVIKGKKKIGHNTDARGYLLSLEKEARFKAKNKRVILLGAGGAARAIAVGLAAAGISQILIANRTKKRAGDLACALSKKFSLTSFEFSSLSDIDQAWWKKADLIVNSTSLGLHGEKLPPIPFQKLSRKVLISDIVYTPLETPLLRKAKRAGFKTHPGWGMLLYQGVLAFELWTGLEAPVEVMKKTLLENLS